MAEQSGTITKNPSWIKDKKVADDFELIQCKRWDDIKDFKFDKGCYVLIRIYMDTWEIGVAICTQDHTILKEFRGRRAQDLYCAIFNHDKEHNLNWFSEPQHIAYLGKELKKAEICLVMGTQYYQE